MWSVLIVLLCVLHTVLTLGRQLMNKTKSLVQRTEAILRQIHKERIMRQLCYVPPEQWHIGWSNGLNQSQTEYHFSQLFLDKVTWKRCWARKHDTGQCWQINERFKCTLEKELWYSGKWVMKPSHWRWMGSEDISEKISQQMWTRLGALVSQCSE